jgi:hypothetical protein
MRYGFLLFGSLFALSLMTDLGGLAVHLLVSLQNRLTIK